MELQKRFSTHFFPCNVIGPMLNFAKDGGGETCPRCTPASPTFRRTLGGPPSAVDMSGEDGETLWTVKIWNDDVDD